MKKLEFIILAVFVTLLIAGTGYLMIRDVDERLQARETETEETDEIVFEPIEREDTGEANTESDTEIQQRIETVADVSVEADIAVVQEPISVVEDDLMHKNHARLLSFKKEAR